MEIVERIWRRVMDGLRPGLDLANSPPLEVLLLGERYGSHFDPEVLRDIRSRIWMTYRTGFEPLAPSSFTSDIGWGCMIRSGQMLAANAMLRCYLGRKWRLENLWDPGNGAETYCRILTAFLDTDRDTSPLSIHRIARHGAQQLGISIGNWFGPSTVSQSIKALLNAAGAEGGMRSYVAMDGTLSKADARAAAQRSGSAWDPLLILVPLRLGIEAINPVYFAAVKACFGIPFCVGIAGGKPNSSLFLLGCVSDYAIHLDPHIAQPALPTRSKTGSYVPEEFASYHFNGIQTTALSRLDPSLVLGFACANEQEFEECCSLISDKLCSGRNPMFAVMDQSIDSLLYDDGAAGDEVDDF